MRHPSSYRKDRYEPPGEDLRFLLEKLYLGLLDELVSLPVAKMSTDTVRDYRFAVGYAFGRYKEHERRARG